MERRQISAHRDLAIALALSLCVHAALLLDHVSQSRRVFEPAVLQVRLEGVTSPPPSLASRSTMTKEVASDSRRSEGTAVSAIEAGQRSSGTERGVVYYFSSAEVDVRAMPQEMPPLMLPEQVLQKRIRGSVDLALYIDEFGIVDDALVLTSSHPGLLEQPAREAALATKFFPAWKAGFPVKSVKYIEVVFNPDAEGNVEPLLPWSFAGEVGALGG